MDITNKIDKLVEANRMTRFKEMKSLKDELDFLRNELGNAIDTEIANRSAFNDMEKLVFLEHYTVRALRNLPNLKKKLESFQKSLKQKIDFLKKGE